MDGHLARRVIASLTDFAVPINENEPTARCVEAQRVPAPGAARVRMVAWTLRDAVMAAGMRLPERLGQSGLTFVAVLLALVIAAALYFGYFRLQGAMSGRSGGVAAIDASRAVACRSNRQTIERTITYWAVEHPDDAPTLAALERAGQRLPSCPEGGRYSIVGRSVECSLHH